MNRVPVADSPALDAGRLLHRAFERHFTNGEDLQEALAAECEAYASLIPSAHPAAQVGAVKSLETMRDLMPAMSLWEDRVQYDEVLEVEQPFEWQDGDVIWLGTPDRIVRRKKSIRHVQNRGLAQGMNFGTYARLAKRHYHEHLYAEVSAAKYVTKKNKLKADGTDFNLVRKLKFRTNVGKKNEATKTAEEMFFQAYVPINLASPHHKAVMAAMRQHVDEMCAVIDAWEEDEMIPAPNEKMNGGYGGNSEDPFFRVLIGEVRLEDDNVFKDREERYAQAEA